MLLFFKTKFALWRDQLRTVFLFYRRPRFALLDLAFGLSYLFSNPFSLCRRTMQKRGEQEIHAYGETPLAAWKKIAAIARIGRDDVFLDLGCGRGKLCFWTACWIGCKTMGVDWVPAFVRRGSLLARLFRLKHLQFTQAALSEISLKEATVLYLYTFHPEEERLDFSQLPSGARVITVSEELSHPDFRVEASLPVQFPWGETELFIHRVSRPE